MELAEPVGNLFLSRHTVHTFLLTLVRARAQDVELMLATPFLAYVRKNVPAEAPDQAAYFASVVWAVSRGWLRSVVSSIKTGQPIASNAMQEV